MKLEDVANYAKIGKRIKLARVEKNLTQARLARLVGCTNNSISHIEVAQTKVSLPMLMRIARVLEKDLDYFLQETPYVSRSWVIDREIASKIGQCNASTLLTVSKILDAFLDCQQPLNTANHVSFYLLFILRNLLYLIPFRPPVMGLVQFLAGRLVGGLAEPLNGFQFLLYQSATNVNEARKA